MYNDNFKELVNSAVESSNSFYSNNLKNEPNPFYVGFGNPNSNILILGKEQGYDVNEHNNEILLYESINNPHEWKNYIDNDILPNKTRFYETKLNYVNAFRPYLVKMGGGGHTYNKYHNLISNILDNVKIDKNENSFFEHVFISEVNHKPSKLSQINTLNDNLRIEFLKNDYYNSFNVIICACGNYLNDNQIYNIFNLKLVNDFSEPNERFKVYSDGKRVLINTRQLSMNIKNDYLKRISLVAKEYLK